jgi:hypothetical protein
VQSSGRKFGFRARVRMGIRRRLFLIKKAGVENLSKNSLKRKRENK